MTAIEGAGAARGETVRTGTGRIVLASLVGTTIEFYDFYIFGTAAALVFGPMFFPKSAPETQALNAYLTFGIAFLARPVGSFLFGHFGDRVGRKSALVATMLMMGLATTLIGALPGYAAAGVLAPWLLAALRFLQGVGLGGEWGGAALIATENAPDGRRAWFGMFPQLGPPIGFFIATGLFLALLIGFGEAAFVDWAWRVPFLASAILVAIGLYVRVALEETPAFKAAMALDKRIAVPLGAVLRDHWGPLIQGSLAIVVCYALFYISTVYMLGYGVRSLGLSRVDPAQDAVPGDRLHGRGDADLGGARRPRRPVSGAARLGHHRRCDRAPDACSRWPRGGRGFDLPLACAWRDGPDLRAARRAAAGTVPDRSALYRRGQRL